MNTDEITQKKVKLLNIQLFAILGFMVSLIISFLLTCDKKLSLENKKDIFTDEESQNIVLFQSILWIVVTLTFLYINYNQYKISKETKDSDEKDLLLQVDSSILAIVSALIGFYIIIKNYKNNLNIAEIETL